MLKYARKRNLKEKGFTLVQSFRKALYLATGKSRRQQSEIAGYILPADKRQRGNEYNINLSLLFPFYTS